MADRDVVVGPARRQALHHRDQASGGHLWSGVGLAVLAPARREDLHVHPANVDYQYLHGTAGEPSGACQPPTSAVSAAASSGPHVPGAYSRTGVRSSRIGCTTLHAASTPSSRAKSVASPAIASTRSRSYASSSSAVGRRTNFSSAPSDTICSPSCFTRAPRVMDTSGLRRKHSVFRASAERCSKGGRFRVTTTSVAVTGRHLPVRIENGTPSQRQQSTGSGTGANGSTLERPAPPGSRR